MTGMSSNESSHSGTTDVVVVGAGPTGMLLAGDLAAQGVSVTLVERRPRETANATRAFAVHARTLEVLDARGLADALVATGTPLTRMRLFGRLSLDLTRLRSRFPFLLITPQYEVEHLLRERALKAGVDFRHDTELLGLSRSAAGDTVTAEIRAADGVRSTVEARYLVGTDGVRSSVRRALGLPFPGKAVIKSIVLADVRLAEAPSELLTVNGAGGAFAFIAPFGDGWYRVMGWNRTRQAENSDPVELDELREIARTALGTDHGMHDPRWISRFHSDERQVPAYRTGRVFLAGDAAHVHSPAGGQGMNTGLQDAANLSWKLVAVLRGHCADPEALLDSYHAERHPVGSQVLRASGAIIRLAMADSPSQRLARTALAQALALVRPASDKVIGMISGVGISYAAPKAVCWSSCAAARTSWSHHGAPPLPPDRSRSSTPTGQATAGPPCSSAPTDTSPGRAGHPGPRCCDGPSADDRPRACTGPADTRQTFRRPLLSTGPPLQPPPPARPAVRPPSRPATGRPDTATLDTCPHSLTPPASAPPFPPA